MFDNQPEIGISEFDYMEIMVLLIEAYEAEHDPIDPPILLKRLNTKWSNQD
ncbi:Putative Helix-turn-helix domain protein (fragment) [Xenorhabdus szentirmaii DSM 16338]|uniref:Helix-turn-helix domain protein n=1 Tax=Xenorhabdus szentirmaii DSM 16338 TaxID=1427518 RepID=W1J056_9GAMM